MIAGRLTGWIAAALLLCPGVAGRGSCSAAEDPVPPGQGAPPAPSPPTPESARALLAEADRQAVERIRSTADWCSSNGLARTAAALYRRVLKVLPDDARARSRLGYRKVDSAWKGPAADGPELRDDGAAKKADQLAARWKKELAPCASAFAAAAAACEAADLLEEARRAWAEVVFLDPENARGREALGHRLVDGKWMTGVRAGHLDFRRELEAVLKEVRAAKVEAVQVPGTSPFEAAVRSPLARFAGPRIRVESPWSAAETRELAVLAEQTASFLERILRDPGPWRGDLRTVVFTKDAEAYGRVLDGLPGQNPSTIAYAKKLAGWYLPDAGYVWRTGDLTVAKDGLVHKVAEGCLTARFGGIQRHPWVCEGVAGLASGELLGTTLNWCVAREQSSVVRADFSSYRQWPSALRKLIEAGEDVPLPALVKRELNSLDTACLVKASSVLSWLLEDRPERLIRFLAAIGGGAAQEDAAKEHLGFSLDEADHCWREWVLEVY